MLSSLRSDTGIGEGFVELSTAALEISFFLECSEAVMDGVRIVIIILGVETVVARFLGLTNVVARAFIS